MSSRKAVVSGSSGRHADPHAAKEALYAKGVTLKEFAEKNGFKYRTVSEVVRGVNKGLYGEGHKVAVALRIK
ncbi:DNA-binding protein [Variovorax sp. DAIF25]|uniref:DNA-binding protein n=1 Tax=Variovorax sp. DAIF25 TaxID=3080983 RepID=UPI003D6A986F